ncbi:hypothetical protein CBR_g50187 [Chara braunii]|uniref:Reverse transcriptase domain-containing protein n=1 Tax=Chara braunii TaxID=69332 RepID=A0A388M684_CHABU|nr:hypothetical protein CBR_g50187 [Chara braunii]|eukprot:GBG90094.1 hypothetical protein CBR_g50187 [Chara braunii]
MMAEHNSARRDGPPPPSATGGASTSVRESVEKCYTLGVCPKNALLGEVVEDREGKRFVVNEQVNAVKEAWLKEHTVIVTFQGEARQLSRQVKEDLVRAYEDGWGVSKLFGPVVERGRVKFEGANVVSYVAHSKDIASWLLRQQELKIKLKEGEEYVMTFKPWRPLQELKEIRLQEAETKFWIMALGVPLDAYFYLHSAVQGVFGEVLLMHAPEHDSSRPKLMNIKFDMALETRDKVDDVLTIQSPTGERWKVEIASPYTDWCRRCRWYFHSEENCPRARQGEGGAAPGRRAGGHKIRFSQHQLRQERQVPAPQATAARPAVNQQGPAPSGTQAHDPRWADQMASDEVQQPDRELRGRGELVRSGGIGLGERDLNQVSSALGGGLDEAVLRETRGLTGYCHPSYGGAANAMGFDDGYLQGRGVEWIPPDHLGDHYAGPTWQDRMEWQAGTLTGEREHPPFGNIQWQDACWGLDSQDVRRSRMEQQNQDLYGIPPPAPLYPTPRYQYNWRDLVPQSRDAQSRGAGSSWRVDRPGPSRLGRRSTSSDWRDPARAGGGESREGYWRARGRQETHGLGGGAGQERCASHRDTRQDSQGRLQENRGNLNLIQEEAGGKEKTAKDLSRSSTSSLSRVKWGSEWYNNERISEHSEGERSSMLSSAASKKTDREEIREANPVSQAQDRRADTLHKSQAEKVQRRLVPLLCTMANDGAYFLALAQPDGSPLLPSVDVEQAPTPSVIINSTKVIYGQHVPICLIPRSTMVSLIVESGDRFYKLYFPLLDARVSSELADSLTQAGVRWEDSRDSFQEPADWLDSGLAIASGVLDVCSRILAKSRNVKEALCKRRVEEAEERMEGHPISAMVWAAERERRLDEWDKLQLEKQKRWSDLLKEKGIETYDQMTRETFQKLQPHRACQQTVELRHPFDESAPNASTASCMLHYTKLYYEDILTSRRPQDDPTADLSGESDMWEDTSVKLTESAKLDLDRPSEDMNTAVLLLDLEKTYDKVGWPFVFTTLKKMGFGSSFCKWAVAMYTYSTSSVMINGHISSSFKLSRSLRQGCPLAPLLFVLQMEVVLNRIRRNPMIQGLRLHSGTQCKVKALADDLFVISKNSRESLGALKGVLAEYSTLAEATVNWSKSVYLLPMQFELAVHWGMKRVKEGEEERFLGVLVSLQVGVSAQGLLLQQRVTARLRMWGLVWHLSVIGQALVANVALFSIMWFVTSVRKISESVWRVIKGLVARFIWKPRAKEGEGCLVKVAWDLLTFPRDEGGLNLVDPAKRNQAQLSMWLHKVANAQTKEHWIELAEQILMKEWKLSRPQDAWCCFFIPSFCRKKVKSRFWKEVIRAWNSLPPEGRSEPATKEEIQAQLLFENPRIVKADGDWFKADDSTGSFGAAWVRKGLVTIGDLWNSLLGTWRTVPELLESLHPLRNVEAHRNQLLEAIPEEWRHLLGPEGVDPVGTWYVSANEGTVEVWKVLEILSSGFRRVQCWSDHHHSSELRLLEEKVVRSWDNPPQARVVETGGSSEHRKKWVWVGQTPLRKLCVDPEAWYWHSGEAPRPHLRLSEYSVAMGYKLRLRRSNKPSPTDVAIRRWQAITTEDLSGAGQSFRNLWDTLSKLPNGKQVSILWMMSILVTPSAVWLTSRGLQVELKCPRCSWPFESTRHLWWECPASRRIWKWWEWHWARFGDPRVCWDEKWVLFGFLETGMGICCPGGEGPALRDHLERQE